MRAEVQRLQQLISITQPHVSAKQHTASCTKPPAVDEEMEVLDEGDGEEHSDKRKRPHSSSLHRYMPSPQAQADAQRDLLRALITEDVATRFANNYFLRRAFGRVGVDLKVSQSLCCSSVVLICRSVHSSSLV